ncbi:MAG: hypothetical protein R6V49_01100 [Bacteroidales bacterium]
MNQRNIRISTSLVATFVLIMLLAGACRKDDSFLNTPATLGFSQDTVIFDTVFTTIGSVTQWLKVYNKEKQPVMIDQIYLAGGSQSQFRMNVDGKPVTSVKNIELAPNDSIFIFVEVTVDPNNGNNPLIITDSIVFMNKGNTQDVKLVAWGQDAHFIVPDRKVGNIPYRIVAGEGETVEWTNDKPYVIYGYAVVDSVGMLRIGKGTRVHFHNNSGLWVYKGGSIKVDGTLDEPVTFQGDRLDPYYRDLPGQWDRIWINEGSVDNEFNHAIIRNGFIGIQAEILDQSMGNKLVLNNTVIENMSGRCLFTRAYRVEATNCLFTNTADITVYLAVGGSYDFRHTTIANYWPYDGTRQVPALVVANYEENFSLGTVYAGDLVKAYFGNCIIYGSNKEEFLALDKYGGAFNYQLDHCLIKTTLNPAQNPGNFINCMTRNQDLPSYNPSEKIFKNYSDKDWRPDSLSVVNNYGALYILTNAPVTPINIIETDLKGDNRLQDAGPDLGALEFVPAR